MFLTFVSGKDNGILLDIGKNMEKLDGREKLFYVSFECSNIMKSTTISNSTINQSATQSVLWFMNQDYGL